MRLALGNTLHDFIKPPGKGNKFKIVDLLKMNKKPELFDMYRCWWHVTVDSWQSVADDVFLQG